MSTTGRGSVRIVFEGGSAAPVSGNLLLLRSEKLSEEGTPRLGSHASYDAGVELVREVTLTQAQEISVRVPEGSGPVCVYLDTSRSFMQYFGVGPGSYYSSRCVPASQVAGGQSEIRLDRDVPTEAPDVSNVPFLRDHVVSAQIEGQKIDVPVLVVLPPGYDQGDQRYPVLYLFHGFGGDRFSSEPEMKVFLQRMEDAKSPMIIASVEGNGRFGAHLFANSAANGKVRDALLEHVIPWVDKSFRTRPEPGARVAFGHSSGGWVALSLLLDHPDVIGFAFSSSPDPLHMKTWWQKQPGNVYVDAEGRDHLMMNVPGQLSLSFRSFVQQEVRTGSFGQFASFLSVFSPPKPGAEPFPFELPFDLESGVIDPAVWQTWESRDLYLATTRDPQRARKALSDRLFLYAGKRDEFGLDATTAEYSQLLTELGIAHQFELRDGGHFSDENSAAFWSGIWDSAWRAVNQARGGGA